MRRARLIYIVYGIYPLIHGQDFGGTSKHAPRALLNTSANPSPDRLDPPRVPPSDARRHLDQTPPEWMLFTKRNADLAARLQLPA